MADDALGPDRFFASRLDLLFRTVHPADRGPYSIAEVVNSINANEEKTISVGYLWQLRKGHRDNPRRGTAARAGRHHGPGRRRHPVRPDAAARDPPHHLLRHERRHPPPPRAPRQPAQQASRAGRAPVTRSHDQYAATRPVRRRLPWIQNDSGTPPGRQAQAGPQAGTRPASAPADGRPHGHRDHGQHPGCGKRHHFEETMSSTPAPGATAPGRCDHPERGDRLRPSHEGRRRYQYAMSLWASWMIRTTSSGVSATRMRSSSSAWM